MKLIGREKLKEKLDRSDNFKLVMVLGDGPFQAKHIPGSLNISTPEAWLEMLNPDDEIVVYCAGPDCVASVQAFNFLEENGYTNIRRYVGGIQDWEEAGYPLKGKMVK